MTTGNHTMLLLGAPAPKFFPQITTETRFATPAKHFRPRAQPPSEGADLIVRTPTGLTTPEIFRRKVRRSEGSGS